MDFVIVKSMNIPAIRKVMNYHWNAFVPWWFFKRGCSDPKTIIPIRLDGADVNACQRARF